MNSIRHFGSRRHADASVAVVLLAASLSVAGEQTTAGARADTRFYVLDWNAPRVAATVAMLLPELQVEFDPKVATLRASGPRAGLASLEPLIAAANKADAGRWQTEVEKCLWNSGPMPNTFRHPLHGFTVRRPPLEWKLGSVLPDPAYAQRLGGRAVFGLSFSHGNGRLLFAAADLNRTRTARELGEPDAQRPLALWPQALLEKTWTGNFDGDYAAPGTGPGASGATTYRARGLWNTGAAKIVCDRIYQVRPRSEGEATRLYLFLLTASLADYPSRRQAFENFVAGFTLSPPPGQLARPVPVTIDKATATLPSPAAVPSAAPAPAASAYQWRVETSASPVVREALAKSRSGSAGEAERLWRKALSELTGPERIEGLWFLARAQMAAGKHEAALASLRQLEKEAPNHPLLFEAAMRKGIVLGHRLRRWEMARSEWQQARKLARTESERWQADCRLATLPYYQKQHAQAEAALEGLLKTYPTAEAAEFVRPYLWYLKNCAQRKI